MGWLTLLLLIVASLGFLWALGARGGLLTASAAALFLGATGYALQGSPNQPGASAAAGQGHQVFPLTEARHAFFGYFTPAELAYKRAAQVAPGYPGPPFFYGLALARSGDRPGAVAVWQQILKTAPKDASWRPLVEQGVAALDRQPKAAAR